VSTQFARFTDQVVRLFEKPSSATQIQRSKVGDGGYADWAIVWGSMASANHPISRIVAAGRVLRDAGIVAKLGTAVADLPDFPTVSTRKQDLEMRIWRVLLRLSAELHDLSDVQGSGATGIDRIAASQRYAKRTNYTFEAVKATLLSDYKNDISLSYIDR